MDIDAIVSLIRKNFSNLLAVYLFGSRADGSFRADSDLDLAVLVEGKAEPVALWELAGDLSVIAGCPVDLLDLRAATTVMQYQVVTTGKRLWQKDGRAQMYESFILGSKLSLDEARASLLSTIAKEGRVYDR